MTEIDLRPYTVELHDSPVRRVINRNNWESPAVGEQVYTAAQVAELLRRERERCSMCVYDMGAQSIYLRIAAKILALPDTDLKGE